MAHAGFELAGSQTAYDAMSHGWRRVTKRFERVVEQEAGEECFSQWSVGAKFPIFDARELT
jgi:hypothetical protein